MTRVIWALIIAAVVFIGYRVYLHWAAIQEERAGRKEVPVVSVSGRCPARDAVASGRRLPRREGQKPHGFRAWFSANERQLADPRKAWIELDLCVAIRRDNPAEAKQIFARVKKRVPPSSPVWPRLKELEKAFE